MKKTITHACLVVLMLTLASGLALATSNTIGVSGGGTLTYQYTTTQSTCFNGVIVPYTRWDFGSFVYTSSTGVQSSPSGSAEFTQSPGGSNCPPNGAMPNPLVLNVTGGTVNFTAQSGGGGSATFVPGWQTAYLSPRYVIVGLTYAPPGSSSNVSYENTTFVGNTTALSQSFQSGLSFSVSVSQTFGAWEPVTGANVGAKVTASETTSYTQKSDSSSSVTLSKESSVKYLTTGTGDAFAPVNHDYDIIRLWLNPQVIFSVNASDSTLLRWDGYGYDRDDPAGSAGPDVIGIKVGCLNGHFSCPAENLALSRTWVSPTITWPAGEGPGLTAADKAAILQIDVFTTGSYSLLNALPNTSSDGRFTQVPYPPNPVGYLQAGPGNGGGQTLLYDTKYVNSSQVAQGASSTFSQSFGLEEEFHGGIFGLGMSLDLKQSNTLTWTHSWETTLNTSLTLIDALSVTGPGCPQPVSPCDPTYVGPGQFIVYQDNLYGTFLFFPVPPLLVSVAVTPANVTIAKGATQAYTATGTYSDGSTRVLTADMDWTSTNTAVATIPLRGATIVATGVGGGSTTIRAGSDTYIGSTGLTVTQPPLTSIAVTPANASLPKNSTLQYTATGTYNDGSTQNITSSVTWTSTNTGIATIATGGLATGVAAGTTTIKAALGAINGTTGLTVTASGGPIVSLSTVSVSFATIVIGQTSAAKPVTLTNTGAGTLHITSVTVSGDFSISSNTCGTQVLAGANCKVNVKFTPTVKGTRNGTLSFFDDAPGSPQTVALTGIGTQIATSPASLDFATVTVGVTSPAKTVTVTNVGTTVVTFTGITLVGANPGDYHITNNTCGSSVAGGASCTVKVTFKPTATGIRKATLNLADDGGGSPQTVTLTGIGG